MDERIPQLKALLEKVKSLDISHDELGTANGFHAAETAKNKACEYMMSVLNDAEMSGDTVNPALLNSGLQRIQQTLNELNSQAQQIAVLAEQGVHNEQFPQARASHLQQIQGVSHELRGQLSSFELALRVAKLEALTGDTPSLQLAKATSDEKLRQLEKTAAQATKILDSLQTKSIRRGVEAAATGFANLRDRHASRESNWFWAFVLASAATVTAIIFVVFADLPSDSLAEAILGVVRRLLLISAPAIFMKVALSKYNLERNLRILYDHRNTVLDQYRSFEAAIGDDVDAKNRLRLEIARYIFSDPTTGYVNADSASEITINPLMSTVEAVSRRGDGS